MTTRERPVGVDFFERQHRARGTSARLVLLFVLAVVSIVVAIDVLVLLATRGGPAGEVTGALVAATALTLLVIAGGTVSKLVALRGGGAAVAQSVGAVPVDPTTSDPQLRRYVDVVEEMSIASGVPVPRLFVLEREDGINAFAAGYTPADAAITVTAGALQRLNRDELQGVVAHEFSHVLNGDMRLNVRLIGLLNGILLLGLVGLRLLWFGGGGRSRDDRNGPNPVLVLALAMLVLGFVGQFFAGLIQAAVSRQREWLADASSVQFTRQPAGLVGALKKIAGVPAGSALHDAASERQINHMLFGEGRAFLGRLWATHPPLAERIRALEPGFRPEEITALQQAYRARPPDGLAEDAALGALGALGPLGAGTRARPPAAVPPVGVEPSQVADRVGTLAPEDLEHAAALAAGIPAPLRTRAAQGSTAVPLVLALSLAGDAATRDAQLALVAQRLSPAQAAAADGLAGPVRALDPMLRLPLLSLAVPALRTRPAGALRTLDGVLDELARVDGVYTLHEYCLTRLLGGYLGDLLAPRPAAGRATIAGVQDAAAALLSAMAAAGNADPAAAEHAFGAGARRLGLTAARFAPPADLVAALDPGWDALDRLDGRHKRPLVEALAAAAADDGVLAVGEAELLRTACALLHCPLPPLHG